MKTTYARGADPRNMSRSTLQRHLRADLGEFKESKTLKRRVFDEETMGWRIRWSNSAYAESLVEWVNGNTIGDRCRDHAERQALRTTYLDAIEQALKARGYVTKRETNCVLVLRRMGEGQ